MTLQELLVSAYAKLGQLREGRATGGAVGSVADSSLANLGSDGDWEQSPIFITYDAAGAGAAPQGEFSVCSAYTDSTGTFSVSPNFTVAPASGDYYAYALSIFPLYTMVLMANQGLQGLGDVLLADTSLTSVAGQRRYSIPVGLKRRRPLLVQIATLDDADDPAYSDIPDYDWVPAAPGSTGAIELVRQPLAGQTLRLWYKGKHASLNIYSDVVSETIEPELAAVATAYQAAKWLNGAMAGGDNYWISRESELKREYDELRSAMAVQLPPPQPQLLVTGIEDDIRYSRFTGDELS